MKLKLTGDVDRGMEFFCHKMNNHTDINGDLRVIYTNVKGDLRAISVYTNGDLRYTFF